MMMKNTKKQTLAIILGVISALSAIGCTPSKSTLLKAPAAVNKLSLSENNEEAFVSFKKSFDNFSALLSEKVYQTSNQSNNFTMSPISVFMALSLAAECADGNTRSQILSALGVNYESLKTNISKLYRSLQNEYKKKDAFGFEKTTSELTLTNSIWLDESISFSQDCLNSLSKNYYCYSFVLVQIQYRICDNF